ncbi:A-kinase anchor protein 5 [Neopelma chrysocephalum]|uniref:A-kinase anchor protein 5 n=1 Tax=Neopelma chrysocephalum TaxID=114329 RepID=UPI000FCD4B43|nr:A-kinase anchor protein 5 [Neopelma chrysocephalum]
MDRDAGIDQENRYYNADKGGANVVRPAKEIQMENPKEVETPSTGATCSPPEEQAEKPSMLCFKKRKKPCKKGLTVKDACEGASEEKSQCVSADQGEAKVSSPSQSSKGAWAAIKNLTRPRRRQKSSSRKKVPSDSQVQLEVDAEESCAQDLPKKRESSGVKMPCVRFSRSKKKPSPSEAVEESEGSVQANEVVGVLNKASEEPEDLAPTDKSESFSPVSAEEGQAAVKEDQVTVKKDQAEVKEDQAAVKEDQAEVKEDQAEVKEDQAAVKEDQAAVKEDQAAVKEDQAAVKEDQDTVKEKQATVKKDQDTVKEDKDIVKEDQAVVKEDQARVKEDQAAVKEDQDTVKEDQDTAKESDNSVEKSEPLTEPTPDTEEHTECTVQLEITDSETVNEIAQDKLQEGSLLQTTDDVESREAPKAPVSKDQPNSAPETTELQEIPNICTELPEGDESEKSINLPKECKAEETVSEFSESASRDDGASVQECSSHQVTSEANVGAGIGVGIVITITEAEDSDNTDSDQAYEPSPVLHQNKQKGNKKSNRNADVGKKEGPEAGGGPQAEDKGLGDQGHRTGEQYELLLIETASSLVKAAIQSSIEQLVNEMALEQNKHNSFL